MLQSITVFLLVLTMIKGSWIEEFSGGGPWVCCMRLFRWTRFLNAICCNTIDTRIVLIWRICC